MYTTYTLEAGNENDASGDRLNLDGVNLAAASYSSHLTFEGLEEKFSSCQFQHLLSKSLDGFSHIPSLLPYEM